MLANLGGPLGPLKTPTAIEYRRDLKIGKLCREAYRVLRPGCFACFTYYSPFYPRGVTQNNLPLPIGPPINNNPRALNDNETDF